MSKISFKKHMACLLGAVLGLTACTPAMDWRSVGFEGSTLKVQLPCKPDRTTRRVTMGASNVDLQVAGCELGQSMVAVMTAQLPQGADASAILSGWQKITLENMRAQVDVRQPWTKSAMMALPASESLQAHGQRPDGRAVHMQAVWGAFAQGEHMHIVHAVVYADKRAEEPAATLFEVIAPR
ncbi:MAG: hypothetical protein RJB14_1707 [Pseudomonadota bacterium]|jgi:hypothetical protein